MKNSQGKKSAKQFSGLIGAVVLLAILLLPISAFCGGVVSSPTEAALNAALVGGGTVTFDCDGTITLTSTKVITNDLVMDATGHNVVISGGNAVQLFSATTGVNSIKLFNLTLADGKNTNYLSGTGVVGGAIYSSRGIYATDCTFSNNIAQGTNGAAGVDGGNGTAGKTGSDALGGAIYDRIGPIYLTNCVFINNLSIGGQGGVGGKATGSNGNGGNGGAGGNAYAGAIMCNNGIQLFNCTFIGNTAIGGSGGNGGNCGTNNTGVAGLGGTGGNAYGGAEYTYVWDSYACYEGNAAYGGNAGLAGLGTTTGVKGAAGGNAYGGALYMYIYCWPINVTFYNNVAIGGNGSSLQMGTGGGGNGGSGNGGGIYFTSSGGLGDYVAITNCTLSANGAYGGAAGVGYTNGIVGQGLGGNLRVDAPAYADTCYFKNTILAYAPSGSNVSISASVTVVDSGQNISSDGSVTLSGTGSMINTDPLLSGLAYNGGPTPTCALQAGSPAINAGDDSAAPTYDQRGFLRPDQSDIGAYEYNGWTPLVVAVGPTASLDGNVGLFFFDRLTTNVSAPLTLNFTIGGTASNGVDYVAISNSVTIPVGARYVNLPIRGIPGAFSGTNKTVTLTLVSGTNYPIYADSGLPSTATVTIFDHNTYDTSHRFVRGSSTAPDFQSFVVPLDYETGVALAAVGGNATNLFPNNPWTTNFYHYDATNTTAIQTNTTGRMVFQNPIVAFGDTVGGSPLYLNRNYNFGVAAATPTTQPTALRIQVYYRSNSAYAGTIDMTLPDLSNSNQLTGMVTNGFTETFSGFGLQTTMLFSDSANWGLLFGIDYRLTHNASDEATNYYYVVEEKSAGLFNNIVLNQSGAPDWSKMYVMEFSPRPSFLANFIDQPHFDGKPLPPAYQGMSLQELTNVVPTLPNLSSLNPSNYLTLDDSPELRRHPILDQFVQNMGNDPLALANYVVNEIDLTDPIDYDTNYNSQPSINLGGVNRSALDTFQEGQGSPMEQCALLVYLLRQAGVPAAYVFPTNDGLQMLDFQVSKLLRMQLQGAMNAYGQTNLPSLINVNYPWVAAYVGTNWVQIFPWLKDTEITEGLNFYDYMPSNYNSGYKWMRAFLAGDTNIFSLSDSDQPLDLLPKFIQHNLDLNHYGLSVDDMGVQYVNRRHLYSQWSDFPKPFALSGTPMVVESLKTNMDLFNTIDVKVYSEANPSKMIDTTPMLMADLHNRLMLLKFQQVGTSNVHNMILSLESYSPDITNETTFSTNANPTWKLVSTNQLDSTDDKIVVQITHSRNRFLPADYQEPAFYAVSNLWGYDYFEQGTKTGQTYVFTDDVFRKGDLAALCFDVGRVTRRMLNVHAQEIWQFNQNADTNQPSTIDPDIYIGDVAYLLGMSYFNYFDQFKDLNDRLHKIRVTSSFAHGYGIIRPQRDSSGNLINNGEINLVTPSIHMPNNGLAFAFNGTLHPDSGYAYGPDSRLNWWLQDLVQGSAAEHGTLRSFYRTNALSSVVLLQQAGTNMVDLNLDNYQAAGEVTYNGVKLKDADTDLWSKVQSFFGEGDPESEAMLTPGIVTNGTYVGTGAILFNSSEFYALVGGFNGGFADNLPDDTFTYANSPNITVTPAPEGSPTPFQLLSTSAASNPDYVVNGAAASWDLVDTYNNLLNNQSQLDPALIGSYASLSTLYGSSQNAPSAYNQLYNVGSASTETSTYNDLTQRVMDPVNLMTGEFYIDAHDITLPGPMPLQIRRNYGSQNLAENEFGFGWKMSYVPFLSVNTDSTLIYAAEMDGTMVAYRQTSTNTDVWLPEPADNPTLNNNSSIGIGSVGNLFNNRLQMAVVSGTNTYTLTGADGSTRTFVDESFPVGSFTRERPYLTRWQDNRGNYYTFQFGTDSTQPDYGEVNRIQSSNGNFVWFEYDVYGHIITAHTGDGRILNYEYDQYGDLAKVTLPDQSEIDYLYQHANDVTNGVTNVYSTHLIVEEDKPDGRVLENIYDSQRRVTNQLSTAGIDLNPVRTATFAYTNNFSLNSPTNPLTGVTAISDYYNHATTYYYTNSLVRKIVDPLNQTVAQDWYETNTAGGFQRSLKSVTDKRGLQTAYAYDSRGNLTNTIVTGDLTGDGITTQTATNSATYNANNLPTQITDPAGNSTVVVYDSTFAFLPQQTIRYAGATAVSTNLMVYGDATNVVTLGNTTQTNVAFGVMTRRIRAYGSPDAATNDTRYSGQGFPTNTVQYTGTGDPNITNQLFYNERDELVQRTDAAGDIYTFAFDPMGRQTAQETFSAGQTVPMDWLFSYYNENGELNWKDGPRYNPEDYVYYDYDGDGRLTTEIHWRSEARSDGTGVEAPSGNNLYAQTFSAFDPLGNLLSTIDPRGAVTTNAWDALGRLTKSTHLDTNGVTVLSTDEYTYEPGGKVQSHTNALGGVTTTYYTTTGKPEVRYNADGSTNAWRYYLDGRIMLEIQRNGAYWFTIYDDASRTTTRTLYSAAGSTLATTTTQLNRRGNVIARTDEGGNTFTTTFDGLDRPKVTAGPAIVTVSESTGMDPNGTPVYTTNVLQQVTTNFYDSSALMLTSVNALGESSVQTFDALHRPTSTKIYSAADTLVRESYTAYSPDHNSVTVTNGSGSSAVINTTYTDNDGHTVLSVEYPTTGYLDYAWNQFDLSGNLSYQEHDSSASGSLYSWTFASYTHDGLNRMTSKTDRDYATTTYAYDALGDVTNRTVPGSLQWQASYNNAGQILQERISGGGDSTRTNTYTYYSAGNAFAGLLDTKTDGRGLVSTYSYDDWLHKSLVSRTDSNYSHVDTSWHYDPRGYVTNVTEQFTGHTGGDEPKVVLRSYDPYGQLSSETITVDGTNFSSASQTWDAAGRRTGLGINGVSYNFASRADGALTYASDSTGSGNYTFDTAGLLTDRTVGNRETTITARDGEGRPNTIVTKVNGVTKLTENLDRYLDGTLADDTLERSDFTDSRSYSYANLSRRLTQETLNINGSTTWTNTLSYDGGNSAGSGVLTQMGENGAGLWNGGVSSLSRVSTETNTSISYPAYGRVNGQSTVLGFLDGLPLSVVASASGDSTYPYQWHTMMELTPGTHQLKVAALHPSGFYTAWATNWFTNNLAHQTATIMRDNSGNVQERIWRNPDGSTNLVQQFTWDAKDRLVDYSSRDHDDNGFNWHAEYDGLNRRLFTVCTAVTNGATTGQTSTTINQYYDPEVEFLELGVSYGKTTEWKLYGPGLDGNYGGLNGTGGLDAVSPYLNNFNPLISDSRGNILGVVTNSAVSWNPSRPTGYGAVPGYRPPTLGNGADISLASAWRGHWPDITGYYNIGMRLYDPVAGMWLSYDSAWNERDPNYLTFAGGDPINYFDSDGRLTKAFYNYEYNGGSYGQEYRNISSVLNYVGDNTTSPTLGALTSFASYFTDRAANNVTPSTYVNQAVSDYNAAGGGALGVLGVGNRYNPTASAYDFFSGYDLINGQTLSGVDRASAGLNTLGGALLLGAGFAETSTTVNAPATLSTRPSFYVTPEGTAIPSTGYRAVGGPAVAQAEGGNLMSANGPTYITFTDISKMTGAGAKDALQLKYEPSHYATFDTLPLIDDLTIPGGLWNTSPIPEPITTTYPQFGNGGASQAITTTPILNYTLQPFKN